MFLLPLLVIAVGGYAVYALVQHHHAQPAAAVAGVPVVATPARAAFWPTTLLGKVGIGVFALNLVPIVLVNVVGIPYLTPVLLVAAVVLTGVARFVGHDRSTSVLLALAISAMAMLALVLFLAGEVFIGHD